MSVTEKQTIDLTSDPVSRAKAADTLLWQLPDSTTEYLRLRDAAVHEALAGGVGVDQVGSALGVRASDVERMARDHSERLARSA